MNPTLAALLKVRAMVVISDGWYSEQGETAKDLWYRDLERSVTAHVQRLQEAGVR